MGKVIIEYCLVENEVIKRNALFFMLSSDPN